MEGNVHVPANQSLVSGCLCGPVAGLIVYTIGTFGKLSGSEAAWYGIIAGGIVMFGTAAVYWFKKTNFYDGLLIQQVEPYMGLDLDGDGEIGPPQVVKVEVKREDGNRWQFADLPGKPENLQEFAKRVLMGQGFTDETGKLAGLTQAQVRDLREAFVQKGWAGWKHAQRKQMGIELWQVGKSVLRAIGDSSPTLSGAA